MQPELQDAYSIVHPSPTSNCNRTQSLVKFSCTVTIIASAHETDVRLGSWLGVFFDLGILFIRDVLKSLMHCTIVLWSNIETSKFADFQLPATLSLATLNQCQA